MRVSAAGVGDHQPKVAARSSALAMASAQPRDHADVDRVRLGDLAQGFAGGTALERLLALIVRQLALAPELDACGLRALAALAGALLDQIALKLGNCRKQRRKQPALRGGCIPQGIAERSKCRTGLADTFDQVKQLPRRASKPIQFRDQQHVPGLERGHQLAELGPTTPPPPDLLPEN